MNTHKREIPFPKIIYHRTYCFSAFVSLLVILSEKSLRLLYINRRLFRDEAVRNDRKVGGDYSRSLNVEAD